MVEITARLGYFINIINIYLYLIRTSPGFQSETFKLRTEARVGPQRECFV